MKVWGMVRRGWHEREAAVVVRGGVGWVGARGVNTETDGVCAKALY